MTASAIFTAAHAAARTSIYGATYAIRFAAALRKAWATAKFAAAAATLAAAAPVAEKVFKSGPAQKYGKQASTRQFEYMVALVAKVGGAVEVSIAQFCRYFSPADASAIITTLQAGTPARIIY